MMPMLIGLAAAFGALIGSFLNVVIYRLPRREPFGMERSRCPRCGARIAWFDNIPFVSYALLLGRCRSCRRGISLRYPLVEGLTALLFGLGVVRVRALGWEPPVVAWAVTSGFSAILLAAAFIDWDHRILPDALTLRMGPVVALIGLLVVPAIPGTRLFGQDLTHSMKPGAAGLIVGLVGALAGGGTILAIRQLGSWLLRKEAMGLGDVKFMAMCGLLLGAEGALLAIGVALVAGAVIGILIWAITRSREIPFGPFLAFGAVVTLLFTAEIEHFVFESYPLWVRG